LAKRFILLLIPIVDLVGAPFVALSASLLAAMRRIGIEHFRVGRRILDSIGVIPIRDHYYEPFISVKHLHRDLSQERELPGIDLNESGQLAFMQRLCYREELIHLMQPNSVEAGVRFAYGNQAFESGDAEYWYSLIRAVKPKHIIEIGGGNSTLLGIEAIKKNRESEPGYKCRHVCVEPYENPWLEQAGLEVVRSRVELLPLNFFSQLRSNDILFIDSSHVIRAQGDVLFEILQVLPQLPSKVIVHFHDIFTPRDYPEEWITKLVRLWNEQYLLEAFLTENKQWRVLGALNYLHHRHYSELLQVCPFLVEDREPGSFYIQKN
jgi:hypothetical protein